MRINITIRNHHFMKMGVRLKIISKLFVAMCNKLKTIMNEWVLWPIAPNQAYSSIRKR
jgi:hypothetical protein